MSSAAKDDGELRTETITRLRRSVSTSIIAVASVTFVCNVVSLGLPLFNMQVFTLVLPTRDFRTLSALLVGLIFCLVIWGLLESLRGVAMEVIAARMARELSTPLIQAASLAPRPDLAAAQGLADLETVRSFVTNKICLVPFDLAWTPVLLLALLLFHWALAALGLFCVLVMIGLNLLGETLSRSSLISANHASATAMRQAADCVSAAEAVMALGMLPAVSAKWDHAQELAGRSVHRALVRARAIAAVSSASRNGMTGAMVGLGLYLALNGDASSGAMVSSNMILARLLLPFSSFATFRRQWADAAAAWARMRSSLETPVPRRYTAALPAPEPRIVVENVTYLPPGGERAVLRGISFVVEPGEAIAIIGPSSAGKSTLLRLMAGLVPPAVGGVFLDGTSTFLWGREDFARHVGYMPQRLTLLEETVADNITRLQGGDPARVLTASKRAGIHTIIASLPQGYATPLRGHLLSAGQRQRLALARALYGDPRVLLLDEPTAFLDEAGEADVRLLLQQLKREGVTVVTVTHRPTLLAAIDKTVVLQEGVVTKFGPTAQVMESLRRPPVRLVRATERAPA